MIADFMTVIDPAYPPSDVLKPSVVSMASASEKADTPALDSDDDSEDEAKGKDPSLADKRRSTNTLQLINNGVSKAHKKIKHVSYQ
jgi:hypothetical protein